MPFGNGSFQDCCLTIRLTLRMGGFMKLPFQLRGEIPQLGLTTTALMEQITGFEPALPAWEAGVLPLHHTCKYDTLRLREFCFYTTLRVCKQLLDVASLTIHTSKQNHFQL